MGVSSPSLNNTKISDNYYHNNLVVASEILFISHRMDALCKQLEDAIICAYESDPADHTSNRKTEAVSLINDLRSNPASWKIAFTTFLGTENAGNWFLLHL